MKHLNWYSMAAYYAELFGRDQLEVHLYDTKQFTEKNLVNLFGDIIGSKIMASSNKQLTENVGLSKESLEVFEKISGFLTPEEKENLKLTLQRKFNRGLGSSYHYLSDEEVIYINNFFRNSNKKLSRYYCDGDSFSDIEDPLSSPKTFKKHQIYLEELPRNV